MWIDSHWGNFEKKINTPTENIIQETCYKQKEAFQDSLENALKKGIEIIDNDWFERLKTMLEKHKKINLANITFQDLNWGTWVFIKKESGNSSSLWVYNLNNPQIYGTNLVKLWIIDNSEFDGYNWLYKLIIAPRENRQIEVDYSIPKEEEYCTTPKVNDTINTTEILWESPLPINQDKKHEIKKWDNLWKIVENYYDVSGSENKNRDIANIILKLNRLAENKWIIQNNDTIFLWKTLHLPHTITTTRKWWEQNNFTLKQ